MSRSCQDHQAAYLDGDPEAHAHVAECETCAVDRDGLDEIRAVLAEDSTWVEPPADLQARILAATGGPAADELATRRNRRRMPRPYLLAAAACVLGVVIGGGAVALANRPAGFEQSVALSGTVRAPQAHATAHLRTRSNGVEIHLDVTGLPTTPSDEFYEAWVKGPDGLVPIGTFHTGSGEVTLWSGVSISTHPTFTVTIQSDDGVATSSGEQVLLGTLSGH